MMDAISGLKDTLVFRERPPCKECLENDRGTHPMEPGETWHPGLCVYVDSWECPSCERVVVRGESPRWVNPDGDEL